MAEISQIRVPVLDQSGVPTGQYNTYGIKDAVAREAIKGGTHFLGVTSTAITDGGNQKPVISPTVDPITPLSGDIVVYGTQEFIFAGEWKQTLSESGTWHRLGDQVGLGALAYKNNASSDLVQPTWTGSGNQKQAAVVTTPGKGSLSATAQSSSVALSGGSSKKLVTTSIPVHDSQVTVHDTPTLNKTNVNKVTNVGSLPSMAVSGEILTFNPGALPTVSADIEVGTSLSEGTAKSVVGYDGGGSVTVATGAVANSDANGATVVTASPTSGTAAAQTVTISGAPSVSAYLPGEETTITVS